MDEKVLLIEDDDSLREILSLALGEAGFQVLSAFDGRQALVQALKDPPDLVILDVMLPSLGGFAICRELRRHSSVPIMIITAKAETGDLITGLEAGADDYITKPFPVDELLARLRALLRRINQREGDAVIHLDGLDVDLSGYRVYKNGHEVHLSPNEFRLLLELARHRGQVLTHELLLDNVWGYNYEADTSVVHMAVKRLREKVEDDAHDPRLISTVRAVGYRLD